MPLFGTIYIYIYIYLFHVYFVLKYIFLFLYNLRYQVLRIIKLVSFGIKIQILFVWYDILHNNTNVQSVI